MKETLGDFAEISIAVPWGHIAGRWYGDQNQQPLLALHGWLDNCGTFARLAPLLTPYTSLLCIDFPGHGLSSHLPTGVLYHNLEFVRVLKLLTKSYNWEKISIIAHSMGGIIAYTFASLYPDCVDLIINLDILKERYFNNDMTITILKHVMDRAVVDNERLQMQTAMDEPPSYTYEKCENLLYEGSEYSVELQNCKYLLERNIKKSGKYPDKYYFSRDGRIKAIWPMGLNNEISTHMGMRICRKEIPFLVIRGGSSTNFSSNTMTEFVPLFEKNNKNFEMHDVDNATHHLHLNNPKEVAEIIIDFLKRKNWIIPNSDGNYERPRIPSKTNSKL